MSMFRNDHRNSTAPVFSAADLQKVNNQLQTEIANNCQTQQGLQALKNNYTNFLEKTAIFSAIPSTAPNMHGNMANTGTFQQPITANPGLPPSSSTTGTVIDTQVINQTRAEFTRH